MKAMMLIPIAKELEESRENYHDIIIYMKLKYCAMLKNLDSHVQDQYCRKEQVPENRLFA